ASAATAGAGRASPSRRAPVTPRPPASTRPCARGRCRPPDSRVSCRSRVVAGAGGGEGGLPPRRRAGGPFPGAAPPVSFAGPRRAQPYVVALMTEAVSPRHGHRVPEVGTGSGQQAAVLAELAGEVYTIGLPPGLAEQARARLQRLGCRNVKARAGGGYKGWPEAATFDAVVVTCGADHVPEPLFAQLKPGGVPVIPVGRTPMERQLRVIRRANFSKSALIVPPSSFQTLLESVLDPLHGPALLLRRETSEAEGLGVHRRFPFAEQQEFEGPRLAVVQPLPDWRGTRRARRGPGLAGDPVSRGS